MTVFPVFTGLSLYLVFLKSFQSQVAWGLDNISTEVFGGGTYPSERVSVGLDTLRGRAVAPLTVLFSPTFISPCLGS